MPLAKLRRHRLQPLHWALSPASPVSCHPRGGDAFQRAHGRRGFVSKLRATNRHSKPHRAYWRGMNLSILGLVALCAASVVERAKTGELPGPLVIPVLLIHYFPTAGSNLDIRVTGDVDGSLEAIRIKTQRQTREVIAALEEGSRYHVSSARTQRPPSNTRWWAAANFSNRYPPGTSPVTRLPWPIIGESSSGSESRTG